MLERMKEIWLDAKQMRDERGLTLIELLVVVVILGIIAAIAVVAIGGLIENSRKDAQVSNAKQLVSAAKLKVSADAVTVPSGSTGTTLTMTDLDDYVDDLKDPMNDDNPYSEATVKILRNGSNNTGNKYVYYVTLKSNETTVKTYFNAKTESELKRSAL